jgi:DNA-binding LacI/PurR family transcriptional regulator
MRFHRFASVEKSISSLKYREDFVIVLLMQLVLLLYIQHKPSSDGRFGNMAKKDKILYKEIEQYMIEQIRSGAWAPFSRIPSENELSERFQVSRITVKNALSRLVEKGVVYRQQGKGTFVAASDRASLSQLVSDDRSGAPQRLVGFLMPRLDNRFTANILSGIEDGLSEKGYRLVFAKTNDSQQEEIRKIHEMKRAGVQGLIIYPVEGENYNNEILSLALSRFPLVFVDRYLRGIEANSVSSDNYAAGMEAVAHLCELGHKSIGFISTKPEGTSSIEERIAGYERALEDRGILIDRSIRLNSLSIGYSDEQVIAMIRQFLVANPHMTAVLTANFAPHVILAAREAGIAVPEDLSVVFFDDVDHPEFSAVPPTVLAQQELEIGREAARLVVAQIENETAEYKQIRLPSRLIVRKSTAPAKAPVRQRG